MAFVVLQYEDRQKVFFSEEKKQKTLASCTCCGIRAMAEEMLPTLEVVARGVMRVSGPAIAHAGHS